MSEWSRLQEEGVEKVFDAFRRGRRSVCAVAPTGFGKTRISSMVLERGIAANRRMIFYTHRKALLKQTHEAFVKAGIYHGIRASGWKEWWQPESPVQLAMFQSEQANKDAWGMFKADLVLVDEKHANNGGFAQQRVKAHLEDGARELGLTATPVGLGATTEELVVIASNSQARDVGAILWADVKAPDEVDLRDIKKVKPPGHEFSQKELVSKFARPQVVGSVYKHWLKHNPHGLPAVGFGPDVAGSMYMCDEFIKRGVKCAHIDGERVYLGEKDLNGDPVVHKGDKLRDYVRVESESGEIQIVWNRFVMREGVDWPHLYHMIAATAFGTTEAWLQSCGRVLRNHPNYDKVLITDHGGNFWRPGLGDPNADREWSLGQTNASIAKDESAARKGKCPKCKAIIKSGADSCHNCGYSFAPEPKCCPQCQSVIDAMKWAMNGNRCPECMFEFKHSTRRVWQTNGNLKAVKGAVTKVKVSAAPDPQKAFDRLFYASKNSRNKQSMTFAQLKSRFHKEHPQYRVSARVVGGEQRTVVIDKETGKTHVLKNIPEPGSDDWHRKVRQVPHGDLQG